MANRTDFYFRQKVTEAELDLAFDLLEQADHNLASDMGLYGIISGSEPIAHEPVPNLTIDLSGPARGYDRIGQRIYFGSGQNVNCEVDHTGIPTEVGVEGQERWLGVFLRFDRHLSDPRIDGNSQQVFFRRDESFGITVRQGPEGPEGAGEKVPLREDELLICDVRRSHGQFQIHQEDIDISRRQSFIFAGGEAIEIIRGAWDVLAPDAPNAQAALDEVDHVFFEHFGGRQGRHAAGHIDYVPHGFIQSDNVGDALNEVSDNLSSSDAGRSGASLIGSPLLAGNPHSLPQGTLREQLIRLLSHLNAHMSQAQGAHLATAIRAASYRYLDSTNVQAQIRELVDTLLSSEGAEVIGNLASLGNPYSIEPGTIHSQLTSLLRDLNAHTNSSDHDERYYTKANSDNRYYTKAQSDGRYYSRQQSDDRYYTQVQANERYYTKAGSDNRYYTKAQSDGRFYSRQLADNRYYTQAQSNERYHTKTQADERYPRLLLAQRLPIRSGDESVLVVPERPSWVDVSYRIGRVINGAMVPQWPILSGGSLVTYGLYQETVQGELQYQYRVRNNHNDWLFVEVRVFRVEGDDLHVRY